MKKLYYTDEPIVPSDVIGMTYGLLFDATQTMVSKIDDERDLPGSGCCVVR